MPGVGPAAAAVAAFAAEAEMAAWMEALLALSLAVSWAACLAAASFPNPAFRAASRSSRLVLYWANFAFMLTCVSFTIEFLISVDANACRLLRESENMISSIGFLPPYIGWLSSTLHASWMDLSSAWNMFDFAGSPMLSRTKTSSAPFILADE